MSYHCADTLAQYFQMQCCHGATESFPSLADLGRCKPALNTKLTAGFNLVGRGESRYRGSQGGKRKRTGASGLFSVDKESQYCTTDGYKKR